MREEDPGSVLHCPQGYSKVVLSRVLFPPGSRLILVLFLKHGGRKVSQDQRCPKIKGVPGSRVSQVWGCPGIDGVPRSRASQVWGCPRIRAVSGELCLLVALQTRSCHRVGIWIYEQGKIRPWDASIQRVLHEPAACPARGTRKPQPRESLKGSFKKNGRDVALKCCAAVSYLRKCVKGLAQLPQGLSPVIKYIWFQSTCKKTTFKLLALFSGLYSSAAPHSKPERLKKKAAR